jgi:tetratricopeptide (TPR) repeat protein
VQTNYPQVAQLKILVAEIALSLGEEDVAWGELRPLIAQPALGQDLLRIAIAGLADSRLPDADVEDSLRRLRLSARLTRGLLGNETLPRSLEPRAHDTLVRSLLGVLDNAAFARLDDEDRGAWLEESRHAVLEMNERFPGNRLAAAATLRLAEVYTDALGDPEKAIELFDAVAQDPSASSENILPARLGLARAYVVAGDTLQARKDLLLIGADKSSPAGQSRAHYHLGLLDFMGGEFAEAEDRFKAVALRAPRADYTNDALDLAILIAEEQLGGAPDEEGLRLYGVMLYLRATHQREAMATALIEIAERDPSFVRDRSRINLAKMYRGRGEPERALFWLDRLLADSPGSRTVAEVLDLRADLLLDLDRPAQATEAWEQILLEHENYVMIDRVRDRLADLRREEDGPREGEVP